jgi:hypothetical protein
MKNKVVYFDPTLKDYILQEQVKSVANKYCGEINRFWEKANDGNIAYIIGQAYREKDSVILILNDSEIEKYKEDLKSVDEKLFDGDSIWLIPSLSVAHLKEDLNNNSKAILEKMSSTQYALFLFALENKLTGTNKTYNNLKEVQDYFKKFGGAENTKNKLVQLFKEKKKDENTAKILETIWNEDPKINTPQVLHLLKKINETGISALKSKDGKTDVESLDKATSGEEKEKDSIGNLSRGLSDIKNLKVYNDGLHFYITAFNLPADGTENLNKLAGWFEQHKEDGIIIPSAVSKDLKQCLGSGMCLSSAMQTQVFKEATGSNIFDGTNLGALTIQDAAEFQTNLQGALEKLSEGKGVNLWFDPKLKAFGDSFMSKVDPKKYQRKLTDGLPAKNTTNAAKIAYEIAEEVSKIKEASDGEMKTAYDYFLAKAKKTSSQKDKVDSTIQKDKVEENNPNSNNNQNDPNNKNNNDKNNKNENNEKEDPKEKENDVKAKKTLEFWDITKHYWAASIIAFMVGLIQDKLKLDETSNKASLKDGSILALLGAFVNPKDKEAFHNFLDIMGYGQIIAIAQNIKKELDKFKQKQEQAKKTIENDKKLNERQRLIIRIGTHNKFESFWKAITSN